MLERIHILLVEDSSIGQLAFRLGMTSLNHTLDIATSGKEAKEKLATNIYDIIFMDFALTDMKGTTLSKELRLHSSINQHTPIVGWSSNEGEEYLEMARESGMESYLTKTYDWQLIEKTIQALVSQYKKQIKE